MNNADQEKEADQPQGTAAKAEPGKGARNSNPEKGANNANPGKGVLRYPDAPLLRVVLNFNARVRGNNRRGDHHTNECQGN
jgi:hypothetical protein